MARVYNFSAGPSMMPLPVLERAAKELVEYGCSGQSVMEMSHRSPEFDKIIKDCEAKFRKVMNIPDNYQVMFLQGGGWTQFAMVPMNFMTVNKTADYILTGSWAKNAFKEAKKFGTPVEVASSADENFSYIPTIDRDKLNPNADYMYICYNNTIFGTAYQAPPETLPGVPLIADISSCILSGPLDVSKFGMFFAGAQKNMGPAGLVVAVVRDDMFDRIDSSIPTMMNYTTHRDAHSLFNTPPTYSIYMLSLVLDWLLDDIGGLDNMLKINTKKAEMLYGYLDNSKLFIPTARPDSRSIMNVDFVTGNADLDKEFCALAEAEGMVNLKGHRSVGGIRASIYNAMPIEGVEKLVAFMDKFEKEHK